ncbi:MAG TPA: hypothetical protein VKJ00_14865 [Thermoanaerobaculia bacterium]|nr:hypothetical protein [Thermoanaerobaculia bacterium]
MPQINVVFPPSGKPILKDDAEICQRGEPITWCFHSANPKIRSVEVRFEDAGCNFFDGTDTPRSRRVALVDGRADFYGHVPNYPVPLPSPMVAKYTITGYDADTGGGEVEKLDPVIITTQP